MKSLMKTFDYNRSHTIPFGAVPHKRSEENRLFWLSQGVQDSYENGRSLLGRCIELKYEKRHEAQYIMQFTYPICPIQLRIKDMIHSVKLNMKDVSYEN